VNCCINCAAAIFKFAGAVSLAEAELKTQTWYFVFQVIQVFIVVTLSSGALAVIQQISNNPSSAATLLAEKLPTASNFFINYLILQGLAIASSTLFNVGALAMLLFVGKYLDKTPRKMYNRYTNLAGLQWGSQYPKFTNLAVIGKLSLAQVFAISLLLTISTAITYSCIAPLILGFAAVGLFLLYLVFRYNLFYAMDTLSINTQGRAYGKALQQLTTGVYLAEVCLIGLFAISTGASSKATGPLVLMILFLIATIVFHVMLNRTLKAIKQNLARDPMASQTFEMDDHRRENSGEGLVQPNIPSHRQNPRPASFLVGLLHPPRVAPFAAYLNTPLPEYPADVRNEAYLNPAITSPSPLLWIVHDEMGISGREKEGTGKVIGVSDTGAWWDEKNGNLTTVWTGQEARGETNMTRQAPIYEEPVDY